MINKDIAKQSAKILLETKSVLINTQDPFTYTSGAKGPVYVDCRRLISFVEERRQLMKFAGEILQDLNIDFVAGGETAGIPYGAFLSEELSKPMLYIRKKPKGFGRMAQIEGHFDDQAKPNVLLVEDLQRDGGSKVPFVEALRKAGAEVTDSFVVFHYGTFPKSEERMKELNINLHSLCTWWDILDVAAEDKIFDQDTISSVKHFLEKPDDWSEQFLKNTA
ncbi:MAG: orotate phosphoribosyltransferase [Pseudomonadota bacterium]